VRLARFLVGLFLALVALALAVFLIGERRK